MDRHPNDLTTDQEIDDALARARDFESFPRIVSAVFRVEPELNLLILELSNGRRVLLPREDLPELKAASTEQILDFKIGRYGLDLWWRQLDDGIYLPNLLASQAVQVAA